jgi:hypothetical protein
MSWRVSGPETRFCPYWLETQFQTTFSVFLKHILTAEVYVHTTDKTQNDISQNIYIFQQNSWEDTVQ